MRIFIRKPRRNLHNKLGKKEKKLFAIFVLYVTLNIAFNLKSSFSKFQTQHSFWSLGMSQAKRLKQNSSYPNNFSISDVLLDDKTSANSELLRFNNSSFRT